MLIYLVKMFCEYMLSINIFQRNKTKLHIEINNIGIEKNQKQRKNNILI